MLAGAGQRPCGRVLFYYLDASLQETLRRHATRPQAAEFTADDMRAWYRPHDLLAGICERVVPQTSTMSQTVSLILEETPLLQAKPATKAGVED
jgi:hypothetical protein